MAHVSLSPFPKDGEEKLNYLISSSPTIVSAAIANRSHRVFLGFHEHSSLKLRRLLLLRTSSFLSLCYYRSLFDFGFVSMYLLGLVASLRFKVWLFPSLRFKVYNFWLFFVLCVKHTQEQEPVVKNGTNRCRRKHHRRCVDLWRLEFRSDSTSEEALVPPDARWNQRREILPWQFPLHWQTRKHHSPRHRWVSQHQKILSFPYWTALSWYDPHPCLLQDLLPCWLLYRGTAFVDSAQRVEPWW